MIPWGGRDEPALLSSEAVKASRWGPGLLELDGLESTFVLLDWGPQERAASALWDA